MLTLAWLDAHDACEAAVQTVRDAYKAAVRDAMREIARRLAEQAREV